MKAAYDHNCRRLWIANVHDPKVAAYQLELFLDMAWDIDCLSTDPSLQGRRWTVGTPGPLTLEEHLERWLMCQFGGQVGRAVFPAMREFYRLCAIRRPEFMGWTQVELDKKKYPGGKSVPGQTGFSLQEGYQRMEAFARIEATVDTWQPLVMDARQDAYFAHVLYPVHAAAAMSRKMLSTEAGSNSAYEEIQQLTAHYNAMNSGKWSGLMSAAPRDLPVFGQVRTSYPQHPSVGRLVSANACDYTSVPSSLSAAVSQQPPRIIPMLGHSMQAVALPKGTTLTYEFVSPQEGKATLYTAMIPTQPSDRGDLRYQVAIDGQEPVVISLKTPYRSEQWKQSVLRGQALMKTPVSLTKGPHKLHVKALDDHIVIDQWMIDFCPDRQFYVIPIKE